MSDNWIRASEINDYVYCRRSWWLKRVRGYDSQNVRELAAGKSYHEKHGQAVRRAVWARRLAYAVLAVVVVLLAFQVWLTAM